VRTRFLGQDGAGDPALEFLSPTRQSDAEYGLGAVFPVRVNAICTEGVKNSLPLLSQVRQGRRRPGDRVARPLNISVLVVTKGLLGVLVNRPSGLHQFLEPFLHTGHGPTLARFTDTFPTSSFDDPPRVPKVRRAGLRDLLHPEVNPESVLLRHRKTKPIDRDHYLRYGTAHRRLRKQWARKVERGDVECWRCGHLIDPRDTWDLDHVDGGGPMDYLGPPHARCNRATNRGKEAPPWDPTSRIW
jgi:hypothetical protein